MQKERYQSQINQSLLSSEECQVELEIEVAHIFIYYFFLNQLKEIGKHKISVFFQIALSLWVLLRKSWTQVEIVLVFFVREAQDSQVSFLQ